MTGTASRPRVCHVTTAGGSAAAGVFTSIHGLLAHLGRRDGLDLQLLHAAPTPAESDRDWSLAHVQRRGWGCRGPAFFSYGPELRELLPSCSASVVHQHGLWQYPSLACAAWQRQGGGRRVVSPHGMLHPWALQVRPHRKRMAWVAYERRSAATADVFHATAPAEAGYIRGLGLRQPIAVIPHGVEVPAEPPPARGRDRRTALFLSRLHPGKRVEDLLIAWGRVQPRGWNLVIAGPDHAGHRGVLQSLASDIGSDAAVEFVGAVHGAAKDRLLRAADLFVLPSLSENFGLVVAEALAAGVPVITTTGTPWSQLPVRGCGWWIPPGADSLTAAIDEAVAMDADALSALGRRGWAYARTELDWDRVATQYEMLYSWLVDGGVVPAFVEIP